MAAVEDSVGAGSTTAATLTLEAGGGLVVDGGGNAGGLGGWLAQGSPRQTPESS